MDKRTVKIRSQIFGFDKKQVDKQLKEKDRKYRQRLEAIKHEIELIKEKNNQLRDELNRLEQEETSLLQSERLIEFCSGVSKKIFTLIDINTAKEIKHISLKGEELERAYDKKIQECSIDIKQTKEQLNSLLGVVINKSENISEEVNKFKKQYNVSAIKEEVEQERAVEERVIREDKVMLDKKDFFEIEYNEAEEVKEVKESTTQIEEKASIIPHEKIPEKDIIEELPAEEQGSTGSFWGEDFSEDIKIEEDKILEEIHSEVDQPQVEDYIAAPKEEAKEKPLEQPKKTNLSSKAVTGEIENLRYKYLVGKLVGEDLLDDRGNIIASQNSKITTDIVNRAEREGKLSELILNMTLPDND
jgi:hypothetical protein